MQRRQFIRLLGGTATWPLAARAEHASDRILYCTHSAGYRHESLPLSRRILKQLGETSGAFVLDATEDVGELNQTNLQRYAAVMFFTTGELPMNDVGKAALLAFVRSGRGFLGVHSATDTFYDWADYGQLIGGYFDGHPWHETVRIKAERAEPLVAALAPSFEIADEIYQIRDFDERGSHVLLRLDETSVDLTKDDVHRQSYGWPLAWTRSYGRGSVFYTALGHEEAVWRDTRYQRMLVNAIAWCTRSPL